MSSDEVVGLRIIGGRFRGRKLEYSGDRRTRPMKDRLREAVFNLVGYDVKGALAIDLFAGTGALGLEAVSRGAAKAIFLERHFPTAAIIRKNAKTLESEAIIEVSAGDSFLWCKRRPNLGTLPWVVFCSPPYDFFVSRNEDMLEMIGGLWQDAPEGSVIVVESDERFDFQTLPDPSAWLVREYAPAVVGIYRKNAAKA